MTARMITIAVLATLAATDGDAQGFSPYYGPDGHVYYRRAPNAGSYAPQQQYAPEPSTPPQQYLAPPHSIARCVHTKGSNPIAAASGQGQEAR